MTIPTLVSKTRNAALESALKKEYSTFAILDNCMGTNPYVLTIDVNGWQHKPNQFGHDFFQFEVINGKVIPMGVDGTL